MFNIQNITLGKRKRDEQMDFDKDPTIFGIVTTGVLWQYIRCTGPLGFLKIKITKVYNCGLDVKLRYIDKVKEILFILLKYYKHKL